jgi:hypothetical protein
MPIQFNEGAYSPATLIIDAHGSLHIFKGSHIPSNHPTLPTVSGKEADIFFQFEADIDTIVEHLTEEEREYLEEGYAIITNHIPEDYFN